MRALRVVALLLWVVAAVLGPPALAQDPDADDPTIERIAGVDRFDTAATISRILTGPQVDAVLLTNGDRWPDALAAGPVGSELGWPLLLVGHDRVPAATLQELDRLEPDQILIVGGPGVVDPVVDQTLADRYDVPVGRLFGDDRYATAARLAAAYPGGGPLVVATAADFADALSGGVLAARLNAPVLLVSRDDVPGATGDAIADFEPSEIVALGGTASIGEGVLAELRALADGQASRIAGSDRFATAAAISRTTHPATTEVVYIANGERFADALTATPLAASVDAPLLLVTAEAVPDAIRGALQRLQPSRIVLIGGEAAISSAIEDDLVAAARG